MTGGGLSSGDVFLMEAAKRYFNQMFQNPPMMMSSSIDRSLSWNPTLHFKIHDHLTVVAEVSETPYPMIFSLRRVDVERLQIPIAIYCVCPEEAYLQHQADAKRVINDGYGLLTVAMDGTVQKRAPCILIIQQITYEEFSANICGLAKKLRHRLAELFDRYNHSAPTGVADVAEVMEGLVLRAGKFSEKEMAKQFRCSARGYRCDPDEDAAGEPISKRRSCNCGSTCIHKYV